MSAPQRPAPVDRLEEAARRAADRAKQGAEDPEPSVGMRLGQIGVLGWAIVAPILGGLLLGRWLDRVFATGILFSAAFIMAGAAVGLWSAWKWMHRS